MRVIEAVLRNPKMAIAILAQGNSLELERATNNCRTCRQQLHARRRSGRPTVPRLAITYLAWNRWWHLTAKALVLVLKKRVLGTAGSYLKREKERTGTRIVRLRTDWSARGRELSRLDQIKQSVV